MLVGEVTEAVVSKWRSLVGNVVGTETDATIDAAEKLEVIVDRDVGGSHRRNCPFASVGEHLEKRPDEAVIAQKTALSILDKENFSRSLQKIEKMRGNYLIRKINVIGGR